MTAIYHSSKMKVIYHSRKKFYEGKDIFWYEFDCGESCIPFGFVNVPDTKYYEYGGIHWNAINTLLTYGFTVVKGNEI